MLESCWKKVIDFAFKAGHSRGHGWLGFGLGLQPFENVGDGTSILITAGTGRVDAAFSTQMHADPHRPGPLRLPARQETGFWCQLLSNGSSAAPAFAERFQKSLGTAMFLLPCWQDAPANGSKPGHSSTHPHQLRIRTCAPWHQTLIKPNQTGSNPIKPIRPKKISGVHPQIAPASARAIQKLKPTKTN